MAEVVVYSSGFCPYCTWAKNMLEQKQVAYREVRIDVEPEARQEMLARSGGAMTVPQIFIGDYHVGGYTDMLKLDDQGKLDPLLAQP